MTFCRGLYYAAGFITYKQLCVAGFAVAYPGLWCFSLHLFTKAKTVIEKVADFVIEAGHFDSFKFGAGCFLLTTRTSLPLQLA